MKTTVRRSISRSIYIPETIATNRVTGFHCTILRCNSGTNNVYIPDCLLSQFVSQAVYLVGKAVKTLIYVYTNFTNKRFFLSCMKTKSHEGNICKINSLKNKRFVENVREVSIVYTTQCIDTAPPERISVDNSLHWQCNAKSRAEIIVMHFPDRRDSLSPHFLKLYSAFCILYEYRKSIRLRCIMEESQDYTVFVTVRTPQFKPWA